MPSPLTPYELSALNFLIEAKKIGAADENSGIPLGFFNEIGKAIIDAGDRLHDHYAQNDGRHEDFGNNFHMNDHVAGPLAPWPSEMPISESGLPDLGKLSLDNLLRLRAMFLNLGR